MNADPASVRRAALSKAPADIAAVIEAVPEACVAVHLDGAIACINRRGADLFGYDAKTLIGRDISSLIGPNPVTPRSGRDGTTRAATVKAFQRQPMTGRHSDGAELPLLVSMSRAQLSGGELLLALAAPNDRMADVSEYIENAVDSTVVISDDGIIVAFNVAATELFGTSRKDAIGRNVSTLMPGSFGAHHDNYLRRSQKEHEGGRGNALGIRRPVYARSASGEEFRVSIALSESWIRGKRFYTGVVSRLDDSESAVHRDALERLLEEAVDPSIVIDGKGLIAVFNKAAEKVFGYDRGEMVGRNVSALMPPEYAREHDGNLERYHEAKNRDASRAVGMRRPVLAQRRDGSLLEMRIAVSELQLPGSKYFLGTIVLDVADETIESSTALVEQLVAKRTRTMADQVETLKKLSTTDELTQMANRREFDTTLDKEISRCSRSGEAISLAMLDIDHFKLYNDEYGHPGGDACLKQVAACIRDVFRRSVDLPARYGGEEFGIVMSGTSYKNALMLGNRLRQRVATANIAHATSPTADHVTVSVGICTIVPNPGDTAATVVEIADAALYRAKASGRDRVAGDDRSIPAADTHVG